PGGWAADPTPWSRAGAPAPQLGRPSRNGRAAADRVAPARYRSYEPSTERWRIVAIPAGFANTAPASPTSAAPAPPSPADRVEAGSRRTGLPSAWAVSDAITTTSSRTTSSRVRIT